jgi:hypothetical protein
MGFGIKFCRKEVTGMIATLAALVRFRPLWDQSPMVYHKVHVYDPGF